MLHVTTPQLLQINPALQETSVDPPIAVNISFCGYRQFLSISFVWIIWVQYATDNLSGQKESSFHRPVLIFQPTVNPSARYKQSYQCLNHISQLGQNAQLLCRLINQGLWRGLGGGGGTFWLLNESLTFKGPAA